MSRPGEKFLIIVVGPTAIGKTSLSIQLAKHFKTSILSADSRQFFKEMSIGTAKPSADDLKSAHHHFIGNLSVHENQSAGQYEREALAALASEFESHDAVIMVGGSGLYVDAVAYGMDNMPSDPDVRAKLMSELGTSGLKPLAERLKNVDPESYHKIGPNNTQRVIRALEVFQISGKPFSSFQTRPSHKRPFQMIWIGLDADRALIYDRINRRVDEMVTAGLVEEVQSLAEFKDLNALRTVGYREIFEYLNSDSNLEDAIDKIKKNTRNFAKRQLTWFRKNKDITWFDISQQEKIIPHIQKLMEQ